VLPLLSNALDAQWLARDAGLSPRNWRAKNGRRSTRAPISVCPACVEILISNGSRGGRARFAADRARRPTTTICANRRGEAPIPRQAASRRRAAQRPDLSARQQPIWRRRRTRKSGRGIDWRRRPDSDHRARQRALVVLELGRRKRGLRPARTGAACATSGPNPVRFKLLLLLLLRSGQPAANKPRRHSGLRQA
jgi:hypothetical protein